MNMLDMHTREKANKMHLDQMHRDANNRRLLRNASQVRDQKNAQANRRQRFAIGFAVLIVFLGSFVIALKLI